MQFFIAAKKGETGLITSKWFLGIDDLSDVYYVRRKVFIEEQGIPEEIEIDGTDADAYHLVLYEDGKPIATGRFLRIDNVYVIGRVAVLEESRGQKIGDLLMRVIIRRAFDFGASEQYVHAQESARGFYEKLGFTAYGESYYEAGIPHISMKHIGDVGGCGH